MKSFCFCSPVIGWPSGKSLDNSSIKSRYGQMDVKVRFYLEDEVLRLWRELESTVVFITHNVEEAVYLAERVIILTNKPATSTCHIRAISRIRNLLNTATISPTRSNGGKLSHEKTGSCGSVCCPAACFSRCMRAAIKPI